MIPNNQKLSYFTTPLYYVNALPHLGHSYTTILGDVIKRHRMQRGEQVILLTGTDEHGEKIEQISRQKNQPVRSLVNEIASVFRSTWEKMGISFDIFYRTTDIQHMKAVQYALQMLKDRGEIVFREYEGLYCLGCERFLTETELNSEGLCPDHLKPPELRQEANYFFLMSRYQEKLIKFFEKSPHSIRPDHFREEVLSFLKQPLTDLCISRPKSRTSWGIDLPFDENFVTYVWFDALLNYLVATGWPKKDWNQDLWENSHHLIAKDILKTHTIYWFAMLFALEVQPPKEIQVSGYWLVDGTKMSKTLGNVVRPLDVEARFGKDTLRFYLLREMSYGFDATFTEQGYIHSINAHLANGIGNLVARIYTLVQKNFQKILLNEKDLTSIDRQLLDLRHATLESWNSGFQELKYQNALKAWSELVTACDLYVNETKPWLLAKDPLQKHRLQTVLGVLLRMIQALGALIAPVLPHAASMIAQTLGLDAKTFDHIENGFEDRNEFQLSGSVPKLFLRVQNEDQQG